VATLTYVYTDSTAVLGPLALRADPHGYDLCLPHATSLSVPRGWEVIRLALEADPGPSPDDLLALADAVREVGFAYDQLESEPSDPRPGPGPGGHGNSIVELGRRGHLTVLADPES
jgi:hypothetical protein